MSVNVKLANILLDVDQYAEGCRGLYFRESNGEARFNYEKSLLEIHGAVDFMTYFNGLSAAKWNRYTGLRQAYLHLEYIGSGTLKILGVPRENESQIVVETIDLPSMNHQSQFRDVRLSLDGLDILGFALESESEGFLGLHKAFYFTSVDERRVKPVSLAVATTTFNNERYILPNIANVKKGIIDEGGVISQHFHMFVVDNGRSLDARSLSDEMVTVLPNPNVGGSGGFARGMMAATEHDGEFTHVIVMDDDVRILPESFIRVFALLSLSAGRYQNAFINGAMLSLENPIRQFEDVAHVVNSGAYRRLKRDINVGSLAGMLENERIDVEVPNAYGAWWFSCIPTSVIRDNGLPMPFFIRCDDVEFGVRNKPVYMTLNGICVWHASFEGRYRASVDCYQYTRNFLAMIAMTGAASEFLTLVRLRRSIRLQLRDLDYISAERYLDGLEDYLKGPEFLAHLDGSKVMQEKGKLNEKYQNVAEMDRSLLAAAGITESVLDRGGSVDRPGLLVRIFRSLPYDRHYLPEFLLKTKPGYVVKNVSVQLESNASRCKTVVYLDATREHATVREMDRARFKSIRRRERELFKKYKRKRGSIRNEWREASSRLASREFWDEYLSRNS